MSLRWLRRMLRSWLTEFLCSTCVALFCTSIIASAIPADAPVDRSPSFSDIAKQAAAARDAKHFDEAVGLYRRALRMRPSWDRGWWNLGASLFEMQRYAEAQSAFQRLAALRPKNGPAWALVGICEYELSQHQAALEHLAKSEQLGFDDHPQVASVVHHHLAVLLNRSGQFEQALQQISELARQGDHSPEVVQILGLGTLRMALLPNQIPIDKRDLVLRAGEASWALNTRRLDEADRLFQGLVAAHPDVAGVHYAYGVYLLAGNPEKALQQFQREIEITPTHVFARLQIVYLYLKQGSPEKCLQLAEEALRLQPDLFVTHNALGRVLLATGQTASAVHELHAAVRLAPEIAENHFSLAEAYRAAGNKRDSDKEMAEFQRLDNERKRAYKMQRTRTK